MELVPSQKSLCIAYEKRRTFVRTGKISKNFKSRLKISVTWFYSGIDTKTTGSQSHSSSLYKDSIYA